MKARWIRPRSNSPSHPLNIFSPRDGELASSTFPCLRRAMTATIRVTILERMTMVTSRGGYVTVLAGVVMLIAAQAAAAQEVGPRLLHHDLWICWQAASR